MRIDREVLVVLAKAAGLTGTKLDPNGADLAAKLLGVGLCLFASALEFICSAIVMVAIPYYVRSQGAPNYMVGCCVGMYYGGELLSLLRIFFAYMQCASGQVLGNPLLIAISNRFGRRFAIILCMVSKSTIFESLFSHGFTV
jgi:MFS family permease